MVTVFGEQCLHTNYGYCILILIGALVCSYVHVWNVPYQITAIFMGFLIGLSSELFNEEFRSNEYDINVVMGAYLPLIAIKIAFSMDNQLVIKSLPQILVISVIGTLIYVIAFALIVQFLMVSEGYFLRVIILGQILYQIEYPMIPDLGGVKNLETLMYGECVIGIAVCTIVTKVYAGIYEEIITTWYQALIVIVRYIIFSVPVGLLVGWTNEMVMKQLLGDDAVNALFLIFGSTYFIYILCEEMFYCSGMLAIVINLYYITVGCTRLLPKTDKDIKMYINVVYHFMHVVLFVYYTGVNFDYWFDSFAVTDILEGFAVYIITNVLRLVVFIVLSPILSRMGYGFDFTSMVTIVWLVRKGPTNFLPLLQLREFHKNSKVRDTMFYTMMNVICTTFINGTTLKLFLQRFDLIQMSSHRQINISLGINALNETARRTLAAVKGNNLYSDANWAEIKAHTELRNVSLEEVWEPDIMCHSCKTLVPLNHTGIEYEEHMNDVISRVLKAQRVSFMAQHEAGYLSSDDTRFLTQVVSVAMDDNKLDLNLTAMFDSFDLKMAQRRAKNKKSFISGAVLHTSFVKKLINKFLPADDGIVQFPAGRFEKGCYYIAKSIYFQVIIETVLGIDMIMNVVWLTMNMIEHENNSSITLLIFTSVCETAYFVEFVIKLCSYKYDANLCKAGMTFFRSSYWNSIDVIILVMMLVDIVLSTLVYVQHIQSEARTILRWCRLLSILKVFKIIHHAIPALVSHMDYRRDNSLMRAFTIGLGLIVSVEEVINIVPSFTRQSSVRESILNKLLQTRRKMTLRLGLLERKRPALTTTVKTRQAIQSSINYIRDGLIDLRKSGLIDDFEYSTLAKAIIAKQRKLNNMSILDLIQPTTVFNEIPWLADDLYIHEYVYQNIRTVIFNSGDILCKNGAIPDGIYIIVAGYFKVTYYPSIEGVEKLKQDGVLPIKEFLEYMRFADIQEDFLCCGNRMCELATLTNRPNSCAIVSEAPSQAFIIPKEVIHNAMKLSSDPVLGIGAKIWKNVLLGLARHILSTTSTYQSASIDEINNALHNAVVPNLNYYMIVAFSKVVENVLLMDGTVVDHNTRDVYTAPCAIPTHVTKLIMPKRSVNSDAHTKLMLFPVHNLDPYEMMMTIEENSELIPDHDYAMLSRLRWDADGHKRGGQQNIFMSQKLKSRIGLYYSSRLLGNTTKQEGNDAERSTHKFI